MAVYLVKTAGHGLAPGDTLHGGEYFVREGGGIQYKFKAYAEMGDDKGFVHLPSEWLMANVTLFLDELSRRGVGEAEFVRLLGLGGQVPIVVSHGSPPVIRRPTIEVIELFFKKNMPPQAPVDKYEMKYQLFEERKAVYYKEFRERLVSLLKKEIPEEKIIRLWDLLVGCFRTKDIKLAKQFISFAAELGLDPLQAEGPRIFWSGKVSKEHAFSISKRPPEATALEKTDIGQLLDKLTLFETLPWELSTLLWALVSRYFGMGATGDIHVYLDGGFALGNVFWNDELPMLRLMQRYGAVRNIIMHIWHTSDLRWQPEFNIQSDKLLLVFDKAIRVAAPTVDNPDATVSFRFQKPIKIAVLRHAFEKFLQSPEREHPLVLYAFRKETCIFARPFRQADGLKIIFFEYGNQATKTLRLYARAPFEKLFAIEKFLMANYQHFAQLPQTLIYGDDAIFDDKQKILVLKDADGAWCYEAGLIRGFSMPPMIVLGAISYILVETKSEALRMKYQIASTVAPTRERVQALVKELFDGSSMLRTPLERLVILRHVRKICAGKAPHVMHSRL